MLALTVLKISIVVLFDKNVDISISFVLSVLGCSEAKTIFQNDVVE